MFGFKSIKKLEKRIHAQGKLLTALDSVCKRQEKAINKLEDKVFGEWRILCPETSVLLKMKTFEECMDKWFEGFNVPIKYTDGEAESFEESNTRVKEYLDKGLKKESAKERWDKLKVGEKL